MITFSQFAALGSLKLLFFLLSFSTDLFFVEDAIQARVLVTTLSYFCQDFFHVINVTHINKLFVFLLLICFVVVKSPS